MDNKVKYAILAVIVIIIALIAASSFLSTSHDDNETHIVVQAPGGKSAEPETGFNPITGWGSSVYGMAFNPLVQSTLLKYDENGDFVGDLATDYSVSSDSLKWTVKLRDDVVFSDGSKLTAKDVAFTFNTAKESATSLDLTNMESAKAVDDTTVEFTLSQPQSTFIYDLRYLGIVKEEGYDNETYGSNPIGSGPYKLKQWDKGQQAIFEINENYYGKKPYFTQITMLFPEEDATLQLAKSKDIDVVQVPFTALNETVDGYQFIDLKAPRAQGVSLPYLPDTGNKTDEGNPVGNNVTSDIAIRKALNTGINRQQIVDDVYKGRATVQFTGIDTLPYANEEGKITDGNIEEAKKILSDAGWVDTDGDGIVEKDGQKASFKLFYDPDYLARQSLATIIAEQAKQLGIEIELQGADWDTIYKNMYSSAVLMQQTSITPEVNVYQQYHSKTEYLESEYNNPNEYTNTEVDAILDEAMKSTDNNQANQLWSKAANIGGGSGFAPSADAPWLWVANYDFCYYVTDGIDMGPTPLLGYDYMQNICDWTRTNQENN